MQKKSLHAQPKASQDILARRGLRRRIDFAKASLAIEGLSLSAEEDSLLESLWDQADGADQFQTALKNGLSNLRNVTPQELVIDG